MSCDRIVVLDNGSIVTQGAPKDIDMQSSSSITRFIENQQQHTDDGDSTPSEDETESISINEEEEEEEEA